MILDILAALVLIFAIIKGYQQGLIVALFSVLAFIIGIAAAMKLSVVVAGYIGKAVKVSDQWLPVISFVVVFLILALLISWAARLIQKAVQLTLLGWINRIGGILLYCVLYILIISVIIFYAEQVSLLKPEVTKASVSYSYIQPWGQKVIEGLGTMVPFFQGMFQDLQDFFGNISRQIPVAN